MPFDSSDGQGEYLINQWLRPFKPKFTKEAMDRFEKGFGQVKVRDPLDIFFPIAAPQNRRAPINIPTFTRGVAPVIDEGTTDPGGGYDTGGGGGGTTTTGSTFGTVGTAGTAMGTPNSPATLDTNDPNTVTETVTIVTMGSGTPLTVTIPDTGGGIDRGCFMCRFGVEGDDRLPCVDFPGPCVPFWGSAALCGYDGVFCPNAYGCGQGNLDCFCGGVNCKAGPNTPCDPCSGTPPCPSLAVICCYEDGTLIGTAAGCCACS